MHVAVKIVLHLLHLCCSLINVSLKQVHADWLGYYLGKFFEVIATFGQKFPIQHVISHIAHGITNVQKCPNEVETHGLT